MNPALISGLFKIGGSLINRWFPDKAEADKRQLEFQTLLMSGELEGLKEAGAIIQAEAKSEHFLVSAWRPITMLVFVFIIFNNHILYPYLSLFFEDAPELVISDDMYDLLKIGLGGYVLGRSTEKSVKAWKDKT